MRKLNKMLGFHLGQRRSWKSGIFCSADQSGYISSYWKYHFDVSSLGRLGQLFSTSWKREKE